MTFEEVVEQIREGSVVDFREYTLDRHERKHLSVSVEGGVVQAVLPANETFSREILEQYYGSELETEDYLQLSHMNCPRIVVGLGMNSYGELDIKVITLVKDFYVTGIQELEVTNEVNVSTEYNYLQQMNW